MEDEALLHPCLGPPRPGGQPQEGPLFCTIRLSKIGGCPTPRGWEASDKGEGCILSVVIFYWLVDLVYIIAIFDYGLSFGHQLHFL
jgi:hypothetical protein